MPATDASLIDWRQRKRRVFFALTPLIDVMFLLLIFFMLSSQISPYALMPMASVGEQQAEGSSEPAVAAGLAPVTMRVAHGTLRMEGADVGFGQLPARIRELRDAGIPGFVVIANATADVQDIVSVLEILNASNAGQVTLIDTGGVRP